MFHMLRMAVQKLLCKRGRFLHVKESGDSMLNMYLTDRNGKLQEIEEMQRVAGLMYFIQLKKKFSI